MQAYLPLGVLSATLVCIHWNVERRAANCSNNNSYCWQWWRGSTQKCSRVLLPILVPSCIKLLLLCYSRQLWCIHCLGTSFKFRSQLLTWKFFMHLFCLMVRFWFSFLRLFSRRRIPTFRAQKDLEQLRNRNPSTAFPLSPPRPVKIHPVLEGETLILLPALVCWPWSPDTASCLLLLSSSLSVRATTLSSNLTTLEVTAPLTASS